MLRSVKFFCLLAMFAANLNIAEAVSLEVQPQTAMPKPEVGVDSTVATLRIGRHQDYLRIVFITTEANVQQAAVKTVDKATITVEFPVAVALLSSEKGALKAETSYELAKGVGISTRGAITRIGIGGFTEIKTARLSSPSRLVIDVYGVGPGQSGAADKPSPALIGPIRYSTIVIDPGHGGYEKGVQSSGFVEKEVVLSLARDFAAALAKKGKRVVLTRKSDHVLSLRERVRIVNQKPPDLLLSLHVSSGSGFVLYTAPKKQGRGGSPGQEGGGKGERDASQVIAAALEQSIKGDFRAETRQERSSLPLLAETNAPAVLIELPNPDSFKYEGKAREQLISALLKGLSSAAP